MNIKVSAIAIAIAVVATSAALLKAGTHSRPAASNNSADRDAGQPSTGRWYTPSSITN